MSSKSGRSLSSRARVGARFDDSGVAASAPFGLFAGAGFAAAGFAADFGVLTATAVFDAFVAVAARVTTVDDNDGAGREASDGESGKAALRRARRADPEDVTLGSSWKPRPIYRGRQRRGAMGAHRALTECIAAASLVRARRG